MTTAATSTPHHTTTNNNINTAKNKKDITPTKATTLIAPT
jgi:hypothetical protein